MDQPKKTVKVRSSMFSRTLSLAKLTLHTGSSLASHNLSQLLSSDEKKEENWKNFLVGQAGFLTNELGELKGSLMKAGQMLSMYGEHFLPPEANQILKSLQSNSPPVEFNDVLKVLQTELGPEKLKLLKIDRQPIGSASMGQVHRAQILATGESIALKVQYPGVERAIESDLRTLKSALSLLRILPRGIVTDHLFVEIREMLEQELDYSHELKQTADYFERLKNDSRYVVPKTYPEFSTKRVLATSFERGLSPDDPLVAALTQERRNQLSLNYLDLYFRELFEWGIVQTDPHLGNYKIRLQADGRDQLVLLDFGAIRSYEKSFLRTYHYMIQGAIRNDRQQIEESARALRFLQEGDSEALQNIFVQFCQIMIEPFLLFEDPRNDSGQIDNLGRYDWKNSKLPTRLMKMVLDLSKQFVTRVPPREFLFLDRKTSGVFIFLTVLRAHINGREMLLKHLDRLPPWSSSS